MDESGYHVFYERQKFSPKITALILSAIALAFLGAYLATTNSPEAESGLWVMAGVSLFVAVTLGSLTLETIATEEGVRVKGLYFVNRMLRYADIQSAQARIYKPLMEYGGWGYRIGVSGKAYNMQGNEGVQLVLRDGGRVLIGSQKAEELAEIIRARIGK